MANQMKMDSEFGNCDCVANCGGYGFRKRGYHFGRPNNSKGLQYLGIYIGALPFMETAIEIA